MKRFLVLLVSLCFLQGCELTSPTAKNIDLDYKNGENLRVATIPQAQRLIYIRKISAPATTHEMVLKKPVQTEDGKVTSYSDVTQKFLKSDFITCAEPSSDIIESVTSKGSGELNVDLTSSLNALASTTATLATTASNATNAAITALESNQSGGKNSNFSNNRSRTSNQHQQMDKLLVLKQIMNYLELELRPQRGHR